MFRTENMISLTWTTKLRFLRIFLTITWKKCLLPSTLGIWIPDMFGIWFFNVRPTNVGHLFDHLLWSIFHTQIVIIWESVTYLLHLDLLPVIVYLTYIVFTNMDTFNYNLYKLWQFPSIMNDIKNSIFKIQASICRSKYTTETSKNKLLRVKISDEFTF